MARNKMLWWALAVVGLAASLLQAKSGDEVAPGAFAGTWKTEFHGQAFIILHLRETAQKLVGSCSHSRSINWDRDGELTIVSEEMADDKVLDAHITEGKLIVKIANAESPEDVVTIELKLTGKNEAEGRLLNLPADAAKLKPWIFERS